MTRRAVSGAMVVLATLVGSAASAQARPAPTPSSIVLNESAPYLSGSVTFTVTYPNHAKNPRIAVRCFQNDAMTYGEAGPADHVFVLGGASSEWLSQGGPASCTAELFFITWNGNKPQQVTTLAWTSFEAAGQ